MMNKRQIFHVRASEGDDRIIRFVASSGAVARDGGIVDPKGWDTAAYQRNPQFLWAHDPTQLPIGKGVRIEKTDDALLVDVEFAGEEQGHALAETVYKLYRSGFMNSVSVGFRIKEEREPTEEERDAGAYWVATKSELLELSAVPIPADPDAVATDRAAKAVREGVLTRADAQMIRSAWSGIDRWSEIADLLENEMLREEDPIKDPAEEEVEEVVEEVVEEEKTDVISALRDILSQALDLLAEEEPVEEEEPKEEEVEEAAPEGEAPPMDEEEDDEVVEMAYAIVDAIRKIVKDTITGGHEKPRVKAGETARENADAASDTDYSKILESINELYS